MANNRMNVLIYSGSGCTLDAVRHCIFTFRKLLSPHYAVIPIEGDAVIKEPWPQTCAMFVMPGGADLGYCRILNGQGNRRIRQFVERGGAYLGFCAGAYYGSHRCEFEKGNKKLEVVGNRELAFFPGICRGLAFPGFSYDSEAGTRAVRIEVSEDAFSRGSYPSSFQTYYNGGGVFVDAPLFHDQGVVTLAKYVDPLKIDSGKGTSAIVYCKVGEGNVILCNTHPEFAAVNLDHNSDTPGYDKIVKALLEDDSKRLDFLSACLLKLGLQVHQDTPVTPPLSKMHLSSASSSSISHFIISLSDSMLKAPDGDILEDVNDKFEIVTPAASTSGRVQERSAVVGRFGDNEALVKTIIVHQDSPPSIEETPYFNHQTFYASLQHYNKGRAPDEEIFGFHLLYSEVVTSTNTLLEKNTKLLRHLPTGFTATATTQIAGRGRGSNVWVSPAGSLMFSTVIRHSTALRTQAPIIFLQYLAAIAIVEGAKSYGPGFQDVPLKIKWPNDVYAFDSASSSYVKVGGILVNSHYDSSEFINVVGVGLNTTNAAPTTSLNALDPPVPFTIEKLLARILVTFTGLYQRFCRTGFNKDFERLYYQHWLHTNQVITLEAEGGVKAKIKGISTDWGLLLAEELNHDDRTTGKSFQLQSDSNSFDFLRGLIKRKT